MKKFGTESCRFDGHTEQEIVLPWPPAELSPNSRTHWAIKARHAKQIKQDCWALTKASGAKVDHYDKIPLRVTFRPPSKHLHDMDNCLSRCKSLLDGVALALGVDDSRFFLMLEIGEPLKGGAVIIKILNDPKIDDYFKVRAIDV